MSSSELRAVVVGAGWAGEGHTKALQSTGVKVEAICARRAQVVEAVAKGLGVPTASTDWRATVQDLRPDIVAVATPGGLRRQVIELACQVQSHVICDKPLGITAEAASDYYKLVKEAGIKHAFAATHRYDPSVSWAAQLLQEGKIGSVAEMDLVMMIPFVRATKPWSWSDVLADGGGMLNNALPHFLGMIERMVNGSVTWVTGEARGLRQSAPYVPDLHDWRQVMGTELSEQEAAKLEWRTCDADTAFSALLELQTPLASQPLIVGLRVDLTAPYASPGNGWYLIGDRGVLVGEGLFALKLSRRDGEEVEDLPVPDSLVQDLPDGDGDIQQKWSALARDFVSDVRGQEHKPYLTFRDGWRYQLIADAIRDRSARVIPLDV